MVHHGAGKSRINKGGHYVTKEVQVVVFLLSSFGGQVHHEYRPHLKGTGKIEYN